MYCYWISNWYRTGVPYLIVSFEQMTDFRYLYVVLYQCNLYWRMDIDFKVCVWFFSSLYTIKLLVDGFINWIWGKWQILPRFACQKVLFHSKHTQICNCNTYSKMGQSYGNKSSPRQQHMPMGTCKENSPLTLPNYMSCYAVFLFQKCSKTSSI